MTFRVARVAVLGCLVAGVALLASSAAALGAPVALVNCGSYESNVDSQGLVWESDKLHSYYSSGGTFGNSQATNKAISNTQDDFLYQSSRAFKSQKKGPYLYEIEVAKGKYTVVLHFCETTLKRSKVGRRIANIKVEDLVYKKLDIMALAGSAFTAVQLQFDVSVSDGALSVELDAVKFNPQISAIGIYEFEETEQPPTSHLIALINAGGPEYTDKLGRVWEADKRHSYYQFGGTLGQSVNAAPVKIAGTKDDALYQTHRVFKRNKPGPYLYEIDVPSKGEYGVTLLFCETDSSKDTPNDRKFDVWIEGSLEFNSLDVVAKVGGAYTALELTSTVTVDDGSLSIEFTKVKSNPIISGISVRSIGRQDETTAPFAAPIETRVPTAEPPLATIVPTIEPFQPILVNCGGVSYVDVEGNVWLADSDVSYSIGGSTAAFSSAISGTQDDTLYQSHRYGSQFSYEIPVPSAGDYKVTFHLAETYFGTLSRDFNIVVEGSPTFTAIDVNRLVGRLHAVTMEVVVKVLDSSLSLDFVPSMQPGQAFISAIQIQQSAPHLAHAVSRGPYAAVDTLNTGFASVVVDGSFSHTHAPSLNIISWIWSENGARVGSGEVATLNLSVGEHTIQLRVKDEGNNKATEFFTVNIFPSSHPVLGTLAPNSGSIEGGYPVTLSGSGFGFPESDIIVAFGETHKLTGAGEIQVIDSNTIVVLSVPLAVLGVAVSVSVTTPVSTSNHLLFTYVNGAPIAFVDSLLFTLYGPTSIAFGPDEKLYIGTGNGVLWKLTLNEALDKVMESVSSSIITESGPDRLILGVAFDPMDRSDEPGVYVTHSKIFHGEIKSSFGGAVNGKVSRVSGNNLDFIDDIVTNLPVSDHDHGVSGLEFGDNGELYITLGGNTNGGVPGALSHSLLMKDNVLGAAILVARLSDPGFDGAITFSADDDGDQVGGVGSVDVFASGTRNPYSIVLHSNGNLYSTDNGPNLNYGGMSTSCSTATADVSEADKLNLIREGAYYGFANRKRGESDPRQCTWRSAFSDEDAEYTAPLAIFEASTNGIIEWQSLHFGGQLRGDLIAGQYKGSLFRILLTPDGESVVPESQTPLVLSDNGGLDLTQGPDGTLYVVKYKGNKVRYLKPDEPPSNVLTVKSVFPRRGSVAGGSVLTIYGEKFGSPQVSVGGRNCAVLSATASKITCTLPGGAPGSADVVVSSSSKTFTFTGGYRFITGLPAR